MVDVCRKMGLDGIMFATGIMGRSTCSCAVMFDVPRLDYSRISQYISSQKLVVVEKHPPAKRER